MNEFVTSVNLPISIDPATNEPNPYDPQNAIALHWIPTIYRHTLSLEIRAERLGFDSVAAMKEKYTFDADGKCLGKKP